MAERKTVAVAVCTYKRNEPLTVLLHALLACAERVTKRAAVGVAIVDDTGDGQARPVAENFATEYAAQSRRSLHRDSDRLVKIECPTAPRVEAGREFYFAITHREEMN